MAGFRSWTDADKLTGDDVTFYLMAQCVPRFADADDRDTQMGGVVPGQLSYLVDTHALQIVDPDGVWVDLTTGGGGGTPADPVVQDVMGVVTLVAGTAEVTVPDAFQGHPIFLTTQLLGTVTVPSALAVTDTGTTFLPPPASETGLGLVFTITASQPDDTSEVAWRVRPGTD